jgi:hypothetical protein
MMVICVEAVSDDLRKSVEDLKSSINDSMRAASLIETGVGKNVGPAVTWNRSLYQALKTGLLRLNNGRISVELMPSSGKLPSPTAVAGFNLFNPNIKINKVLLPPNADALPELNPDMNIQSQLNHVKSKLLHPPSNTNHQLTTVNHTAQAFKQGQTNPS